LELDQRASRVLRAWREWSLQVSRALLLALRALRELRASEQVWLAQQRKALHSARAFPPSVYSHLPATVVDLAF